MGNEPCYNILDKDLTRYVYIVLKIVLWKIASEKEMRPKWVANKKTKS